MKKNNKNQESKKSSNVSPEEAVRFLEDIRLMVSEFDEPTTAISLRIPGNVLRAVKLQAKADGKKYQSLIVDYIRKGLHPRK